MQPVPSAIVFQVLDSAGAGVPGAIVQFDLNLLNVSFPPLRIIERYPRGALGQDTTDSSGFASIRPIIGTDDEYYEVAGAVVGARIPPAGAIVRLTAGPPAALKLWPDTITRRVGQTFDLFTTVADAWGNFIFDARPELVSLTPSIVELRADRERSAIALAPGAGVIAARLGGLESQSRVNVVSWPGGPPARLMVISGDSQSVTPEQRLPRPIVLQVVDSTGRGTPGVAVRFVLNKLIGAEPNYVRTLGSATTDGDGLAGIQPIIGTQVGLYEVEGTIADMMLAPVGASVLLNPGQPANLTLHPDTSTVRIGRSVHFSTTVEDAWGNHISAHPELVNLTPSILELSGTSATARAEGIGIVSARFAGLGDQSTIRVVLGPTGPDTDMLALGARHSCMLRRAGTVHCWGAVPSAPLPGETCGAANCVRVPQLVVSPVIFDTIAAGGDQTCALSGTALYCWGRGGAIPGGIRASPTLMFHLSPTSSITLGRDHACATVDGLAYCWGDNARGQLGTGNRTSSSTPVPVSTSQRFLTLRAGPQHTCGLTVERSVYCWGANAQSELGRGTASESEPLPAEVPFGNISVFGLSPGAGSHSCASVGSGHAVYCWGPNDFGQFGNGPTLPASLPRMAPVAFFSGTTETATCGTDGKAGYCYGRIGQYEYAGVVYYSGSSLATGGQHACAWLTPGGVQPSGWTCWGDNSFGQLGNGTLTHSRTPVPVLF
jgi:hypothetical protein